MNNFNFAKYMQFFVFLANIDTEDIFIIYKYNNDILQYLERYLFLR